VPSAREQAAQQTAAKDINVVIVTARQGSEIVMRSMTLAGYDDDKLITSAGQSAGGLLAWRSTGWLGCLIRPGELSAFRFCWHHLRVCFSAFVLKLFRRWRLGVWRHANQYRLYADILYHSMLRRCRLSPPRSASGLAMRGRMVRHGRGLHDPCRGEGFTARRMFFWYGMRNRIAAADESLAISLGPC